MPKSLDEQLRDLSILIEESRPDAMTPYFLATEFVRVVGIDVALHRANYYLQRARDMEAQGAALSDAERECLGRPERQAAVALYEAVEMRRASKRAS